MQQTGVCLAIEVKDDLPECDVFPGPLPQSSDPTADVTTSICWRKNETRADISNISIGVLFC